MGDPARSGDHLFPTMIDKTITFINIESTGTNVSTDRIIDFAAVKIHPGEDGKRETWQSHFNPVVPIPPEITELTGITTEMVANKPFFKDKAREIIRFLNGSVLAGYHLHQFDIPLLWEECFRAGVMWVTKGVQSIDVCSIFKKKEPRDLEAAMKFYTGEKPDESHGAMADVESTIKVFMGQRRMYSDVMAMSVSELDKFSRYDERVDLAGKIVLNKDGVPCYAFGDKTKGVPVLQDRNFANWILNKDFPEQTKQVLREILRGSQPQQKELL